MMLRQFRTLAISGLLLTVFACGGDRPSASERLAGTPYPIHTGVTATVFWIGEDATPDNTFITNAVSTWDDDWLAHYGGVDDPFHRDGYYPVGFVPRENPFYFDLPYDDFNDDRERRPNAARVVYWSGERAWGPQESMLKNRWLRVSKGDDVCYAQWEDAGPFLYNDAAYVFGNDRPKNRLANRAGMDVSPALRDCLHFNGPDNADNMVDWQFIDAANVPDGPWRRIVTTSGVTWR